MIFDTHAHYDDERFNEDREEVLESLKLSGVDRVVNSGASMRGCRDALKLSEKYDFIYATVGLHPEYAEEWNESVAAEIEEMSGHPKCLAIGEIGLDYYYGQDTKEAQKKCFEDQLKMAKRLGKPVVIHSRDAAEDTMRLLRDFCIGDHPMIDVHCYSYSPEIAAELVKMGCFLGVGGVVTFKNSKKLKETVEKTPIEHILLETDCPYLAPEPHRGKRNDSRNLPFVAAEIARLKGMEPEEVIEITAANARRLYGISG